MGCGFSRLGCGNGLSFPAKLRPQLVFHQNINKSKRPLKNSDSAPSKKLLLLHDAEKDTEDDHSFYSCKTPSKRDHRTDILEESSREKGQNGHVKEGNIVNDQGGCSSEIEDEFIDACNHDHDDDDSGDERMIGNNDIGFMGSPSFRVYCNNSENEEFFDAGNSQDSSEDSVSGADIHTSPEVKSVVVEKNKVEKRGKRKKNSLRKVLPKVFGGRSRNRKLTEVDQHQNSQ